MCLPVCLCVTVCYYIMCVCVCVCCDGLCVCMYVCMLHHVYNSMCVCHVCIDAPICTFVFMYDGCVYVIVHMYDTVCWCVDVCMYVTVCVYVTGLCVMCVCVCMLQ